MPNDELPGARIKAFHLRPTERIPNSPFPLLHYVKYFDTTRESNIAGAAYDLLQQNGWQTQWIYRYGHTQQSHYHSTAHECMTVLSGTATIRFGVADTSSDLEANTEGSSYERDGIEISASAGDVFLVPAGVAHKTYNTNPKADFVLLTPGDGSGVRAREAVESTQLDGFTMLGAYPTDQSWDFQTNGAACRKDWSKIWGIPRPPRDPLLGQSSEGLCGLWQDSSASSSFEHEQSKDQ